MADVRKIIEDKIAKNKVMMFSKSYCPYCTMAKTGLSNFNLGTDEYKIWEIEREPNCAEIQSVLRDITGAQSVMIYLFIYLRVYIFIYLFILIYPVLNGRELLLSSFVIFVLKERRIHTLMLSVF
jgi:glutaredoxin